MILRIILPVFTHGATMKQCYLAAKRAASEPCALASSATRAQYHYIQVYALCSCLQVCHASSCPCQRVAGELRGPQKAVHPSEMTAAISKQPIHQGANACRRGMQVVLVAGGCLHPRHPLQAVHGFIRCIPQQPSEENAGSS